MAVPGLAAPTFAAAPTFYRDVLPILENRCQECHRAGEMAPMPLVTYREARPWAKAIREATRSRKMPPWFADPCCGKFSDDRSLTAAEIDTLAAWAATGAVGLRVDWSRGVDVGGVAVDGGGGEVDDPRGGGAEGVEQTGRSSGRDGMEHENAGVKVRG